jgi:hypothetical protein
VRLPDVAVPVATYTGWNLYKSPYPDGEICDRDGSYLPFARTAQERHAAGDPRPALGERYPTPADYAAKVEEAARALVRDRLLLEEDAEAYVRAARLAKDIN